LRLLIGVLLLLLLLLLCALGLETLVGLLLVCIMMLLCLLVRSVRMLLLKLMLGGACGMHGTPLRCLCRFERARKWLLVPCGFRIVVAPCMCFALEAWLLGRFWCTATPWLLRVIALVWRMISRMLVFVWISAS
jgi:hypothetical protein